MSEITITKRAAIYLRVSTEMQTGRDGDAEGYSIPAQREAGTRKAAELGAELVAEFSDPGVSGQTDKRKGLQALLERIRTVGDIDYVIVWKLSRLSRNPLLDATLELELKEHGVRLISVTENIDETPGGKLLKRILNVINAYEVDNLSQGVSAGISKKARSGGTPTRAPLGYINVRRIVDGNEIRTVETDPDRASLVQWCFKAYATGTYTITSLQREATAKGLRTRQGKKQASKMMVRSAFAKMLSNPYYTGIVRYKGAEYPGRHEPLISRELFDRVQEALKANMTGEKVQQHPHYLKGSIYCARCLSRFSMTYAKGNGGIYGYFFCLGRQAGNGCDQPYLPIIEAEEEVARFYRAQQLDAALAEKLRMDFRTHLKDDQKRLTAEAVRQGKRLEDLMVQRRKILDLHYKDAIAPDLFEEEQDRINLEIKVARRAIQEAEQEWGEIETANDGLFDLIQDLEKLYRSVNEPMRRRLNRLIFSKILLDSEDSVTGELAEPPSADWAARYLKVARKRVPNTVGALALKLLQAQGPAIVSSNHGSNIVTLVDLSGLEPGTLTSHRRSGLGGRSGRRRNRDSESAGGRRHPRVVGDQSRQVGSEVLRCCQVDRIKRP